MRSIFVSASTILVFWGMTNLIAFAQALDPADDPGTYFTPDESLAGDIPREIEEFDVERDEIIGEGVTEPRIHAEADLDYYLGGIEIEHLYEEAEFPPALVQPVEYLDQFPPDVARVLTFIGGIPVISSPYIGERTPFDAAHLITNFPKTRLDENFLIQRQNIEEFLIANGIPLSDRPFVDLSGDVEMFAFVNSKNTENSAADSATRINTDSGVDISEIEIDVTAGISSWVSTFVALLIDASPEQEGGPPAFNSKAFLEVGFVTVGNLNRFPIFGTLGQIYVPFGRYVNYAFATTLPRIIGRTKARAFSLNFRSGAETGFYTSAYAFDGVSGPGRNGSGGVNLTYFFSKPTATGEFGVGAISNMGDATQGLLGFAGIGDNIETLRLNHQVQSINVYGRVNIWKLGLVAEYVGATRTFDPNDLAQNGHGAQPQAWSTQIAYFFETAERPSSVVFAYEGSSDTFALAIPEQRYSIGYNISIWRNTVQQFELRRDIGFKGTTSGNGPIRIIDDVPIIFGLQNTPVTGTSFTFLMGAYY